MVGWILEVGMFLLPLLNSCFHSCAIVFAQIFICLLDLVEHRKHRGSGGSTLVRVTVQTSSFVSCLDLAGSNIGIAEKAKHIERIKVGMFHKATASKNIVWLGRHVLSYRELSMRYI